METRRSRRRCILGASLRNACMLMRRRSLVVVVAAAVAGLCGAVAYACHADTVERPADRALIETFHAHVTQLRSLRCPAAGQAGEPFHLRGLDADIWCDYDGSIRLIFGASKLGLAVGPG